MDEKTCVKLCFSSKKLYHNYKLSLIYFGDECGLFLSVFLLFFAFKLCFFCAFCINISTTTRPKAPSDEWHNTAVITKS